MVNNALESIDFVNNDDIYKKELTIKYDSEPGFYLINMMLKIFIGQKTINGIW